MIIEKFLLIVHVIFILYKQINTQNLCESKLSSTEDLTPFRNLIHKDTVPLDKQKAGNFSIAKEAKNLTDCIKKCCKNRGCTSIWMHKKNCYLIACESAKSCSPNSSIRSKDSILVNIRDPNCKPACQSGKKCINGECKYRTKSCEIGLMNECYANEECRIRNSRKRNGICVCKRGYARDRRTNICIKGRVI